MRNQYNNMAKETVAKQVASRIAYVEPNDIYGVVDGVPLTPNYEDFCIGFNLVAEKVNRFNSNEYSGVKDLNDADTMRISWGMDTKREYTSFLSGEEDKNGVKFLTTYYTDITYEDVKGKSIVEGIGVESVNIVFESFYTPTITIKFVDVRGASLFGREAAIHEQGEISAENIFGCFFTLPYPKFKLQIKGFYGKDVTYQLTCSNFKGSFNATSGNFEFIATFIGYNYAILTDIPFVYLVSAPFCSYEGRKYWESHIDTPSWRIDGKPMVSIHSFMNAIESHTIENLENNGINEEDRNRMSRINSERSGLNEILTAYNTFVSALQQDAENAYILERNVDKNIIKNQILLMYNDIINTDDDTCRRKLSDAVVKAHIDLVTKVTDYNRNNTGNTVDINKLPNNMTTAISRGHTITLVELFNIKTNENNVIEEITCLKTNGKSKEDLQKIQFNSSSSTNASMKLTPKTAETLSRMITTKPYNTNIKKYGFLINLNDLSDVVKNKVEALNEEYNFIQDKINKQRGQIRVDALPFKPTIGNIFKMIMAHLETFMHVMVQCKNDIISSGSARNPSALGVNIENTDVLSSSTLPPFPAVYTKGTPSQNSGDTNNENFVLGWVGDFSHNFIEEKVVLSIWKAVSRIMDESKTENNNKNIIKFYPAFPGDFNSYNNPFANTTQVDISSLGGYLGIRAAQIFGVLSNENYSGNLSNELISAIGRMDAYNYYMELGSAANVKMEIFDKIGSQNAQTILKNIALCDESVDFYGVTYLNTGKVRHKFENDIDIKSEYNNNQRCPMLASSNKYSDRYVFSRYYNEDGVTLVPSRLDEFRNYRQRFIFRRGDDGQPYFIQQSELGNTMNKADNFINRSTTNSLWRLENDEFKKNYYNDDLFNVVTDSNDVDDVIVRYKELKDGKVNMVDYTNSDDFTSILNKFWIIEESKYSPYYDGYSNMFTVPVKVYGFNENNLFPLMKTDTYVPTNLKDNSWIRNDATNGVKYTDKGEYTYMQGSNSKQTVTIDDLRIHQAGIYYTSYSTQFNLFGHSFYYMQNNKIGKESDSEYNDRINKVKSLLFLHTLKYNFDNIPNAINRDKKNGGIEAVPYGYLLLIGGLLWRNRYIQEHENTDPIIYSEDDLLYKPAGINNTLFSKIDGKYKFYVMDISYTGVKYNVSLPSLLGYDDTEDWELDYVVENRLIKLFENFTNREFRTILNKAELQYRVEEEDENGNTRVMNKSFTAKTFVNEFVSKFSKALYTDNQATADVVNLYKTSLNNFYGNYRYCYIDKTTVNCVNLMFNDDSDIQQVFKDIYYGKSIIIDSLGYRLTKNDNTQPIEVYVKKTTFDTYINSFCNQLQKMADSKSSSDPLNEEDSDKIEHNKAHKIEIYYYLKNLYDKWVIQMRNDDYYSVDNFFKKNFVFLDKFYRNIYNQLIINCDKLLDIFHNRLTDRNASLFSVLGDIVQEHTCLLVSLADYISFGNNDINKDIEELEKAFKPMPYNEMGEMRDENHFVVMFTGGGASIASEDNYYRHDGFDINTPDDIPSPFKSKSIIYDENDIETRYGYNVPSFGVSFGRQNQSLFKNITVNMESPAMTEIAAINLAHVAELGSSHEHRVAFYGQDIYNIFKNYSYECEVEMLGDAQIQPLMYFQLLNIPMWHGAYMIKSVTHTMTPGNMTTKFKGQKMSKYIQPFCDDYYIGVSSKDFIEPMNRGGENIYRPYNTTITDVVLPEKYESPSSDTVDDVLEQHVCGATISRKDPQVELYRPLRILFNTLVEEIKMLPENRENETWTICINSALRDGDGGSEHNYKGTHAAIYNYGISPNAIDLQIAPVKNGKIQGAVQDIDKMFKVMDIICTNHFNEIGQLIFEGKGKDHWLYETYKKGYNCLHLSYFGNTLKGGSQIIFLADDYNGTNFAKVKANVGLYSDSVPPEYKAIAKKYYMTMNDNNKFRKTFTFYCQFDDDQLKEHFGEIRVSSSDSTGYINAADNDAKKRNNPGDIKWKKIVVDSGIATSVYKTGDEQWFGYDISGTSWSPNYCVFKSLNYGLYAMFLDMNEQIVKNGKNKIGTLMTTYLKQGTRVQDYAKKVASKTNVNTDTFTMSSILNNEDVFVNMAEQICINKAVVPTKDVIKSAYQMACGMLNKK